MTDETPIDEARIIAPDETMLPNETILEDAAPVVAADRPRGVGRSALVAAGLVATLAGALGGWALSEMVSVNDVPDVAPLEARLATLETDLEDASALDTLEASITEIEQRIAAIDARVDALPSDTLPLDPALRERLEEIDALAGGGTLRDMAAVNGSVMDLNERMGLFGSDLERLETRLSGMNAYLDALGEDGPVAAPNAVSNMALAALSSDGASPGSPPAQDAAPTPDKDSAMPPTGKPPTGKIEPTLGERIALLPPFPKAAVETAVEPDRGSGFQRFVRVRDLRTLQAVEEIENALGREDLDAALDAYDDLPEAGQRAARAWAKAARLLRDEFAAREAASELGDE